LKTNESNFQPVTHFVEKRAIDFSILTNGLQSLEYRQVGMLSLFYRYFNGRCSKELALLTPSAHFRIRKARQMRALWLTLVISTTQSWVQRWLWNGLPASVFPPSFTSSSKQKDPPHSILLCRVNNVNKIKCTYFILFFLKLYTFPNFCIELTNK